ncbi:MAG: hypothetical protein IJI22_05755 [Bacilli bacterium]|nr:hypothetical protein [Bacilli bacterium]
MKTRIFIDMDGTLAEWRDIKSNSELYEKGYYESLKPNNFLLEEVKNLIKEGKDIYILSSFLSDSNYALKEKNLWLNKYLPELPIQKRIFVPYGDVKYKYLPSKITAFDYLVDDHTKNLLDWKDAGGTGIKFLNGINHIKGVWQGLLLREDEDISKNFNWILDNCFKEPIKSFEFQNLEEDLEVEI